jgi:MFS family permease
VLTAMIFAVAMTFIDQTIVSIAAPTVQHDLGLSSSGMQWAINAYLLALAALFAFGGRLADTVGHRTMVVTGVIIFAAASALCGATPRGGAAEAWLVTFRAVQGLGGALMFPAAIAIVVATFDLHSRGRALALFFGIAGGLTAIGPIAGGYLIQWTWRSIFWINVPVAIIALVLIAISKPGNEHRPAPIDYRGLALVVGGVGLSVFGSQQSALWGWGNPAIEVCIAAGVVLLVVYFFLWAGQVTGLRSGSQVIWIIMAGAGMGLMLGQANTDAINRASRFSYGEATGITQTVRNYGASLGFAILGTVLINEFRSYITSSLTAQGVPAQAAAAQAARIAQLQGGSGSITAIPQFIRADFAVATKDVLYGMGIIMADHHAWLRQRAGYGRLAAATTPRSRRIVKLAAAGSSSR